MNSRGFIHSFESFGTVDGPGVRYVIFFQGCPLRCQYCHNPDTWQQGAGTEYTVPQVMKRIESCRNFISGGVTLSGGEPLMQSAFAAALLAACRDAGFHTAVDSSGAVPLTRCAGCIDLADLLLLDIKALDPVLCKSLTGLDSTNALAVLDYCEKKQKAVWIRHVLVPGITLKMELLQKLAVYLQPYRCIQKIELLPFHKMAEHKWKQLDLPYSLSGTPEPAEHEVVMAKEVFRKNGIPIQ